MSDGVMFPFAILRPSVDHDTHPDESDLLAHAHGETRSNADCQQELRLSTRRGGTFGSDDDA